MKNTLAILVLLFSGLLSQAQDTLPLRNSKSYLILKEGEKDSAYLDEKCRQAGLDMGIEVLANRIPTNSKLVSPRPSEHLLRQGALRLLLPLDEKDTEFAVYRSELFDQPATINVLLIDDELITYRSTEPSTLIHMSMPARRHFWFKKAVSFSSSLTMRYDFEFRSGRVSWACDNKPENNKTKMAKVLFISRFRLNPCRVLRHTGRSCWR